MPQRKACGWFPTAEESRTERFRVKASVVARVTPWASFENLSANDSPLATAPRTTQLANTGIVEVADKLVRFSALN
jgi:hypothetical protein